MFQRSSARKGGPYLTELPARTSKPVGLVLVLHGGRKESHEPTAPWQPAVLRMRPFTQAAHRGGHARGVAVWELRNRYRGWNGGAADPVRDVRWALEQARTRLDDPPVALVGHSMGGRAALLAACDPLVSGVVALAPWLPDNENEPVNQLAGRSVLIAHGDRDHRTDPAASYGYARRARTITPAVCRFDVRGDGHAMLRRPTDWHRLAVNFALGVLNIHPFPPVVTNAMRETPPEGLNVPLPRGC